MLLSSWGSYEPSRDCSDTEKRKPHLAGARPSNGAMVRVHVSILRLRFLNLLTTSEKSWL